MAAMSSSERSDKSEKNEKHDKGDKSAQASVIMSSSDPFPNKQPKSRASKTKSLLAIGMKRQGASFGFLLTFINVNSKKK